MQKVLLLAILLTGCAMPPSATPTSSVPGTVPVNSFCGTYRAESFCLVEQQDPTGLLIRNG